MDRPPSWIVIPVTVLNSKTPKFRRIWTVGHDALEEHYCLFTHTCAEGLFTTASGVHVTRREGQTVVVVVLSGSELCCRVNGHLKHDDCFAFSLHDLM